MLILCTSVAHASFADQLDRPGVEWLTLQADGTLHDGNGRPVGWDDARPEVAWGTSDLFREGAPIGAFFSSLVRLDSLRWFASPAAGYDAPVFAQLASRGVRVTNAHVNSVPIAEYVIRAVLDEFQRAAEWRGLAEERSWRIHDWREVSGTTWLVVGLGGIGTEVAVRARALGAGVIGCRRRPGPGDPTDRTVTPDQLPGVVGLADVVVLAAPANPETTDLVDAAFLAAMKSGSVLVNVARGSLVDEDALLVALDGGVPSVAVLDVFRTEPLPDDHPFWTHPAVRVTPHNSAGGLGRLQRQADLFAENLDRYRSGEALLYDITAELTAAT
jgi:phosphoglycerate dehydrogenase-like enzyme